MSITFTDKEWESIERLRITGLRYLQDADKLERMLIIKKRSEQYDKV